MVDPSTSIRLQGIRQNNLKGFDLDIPLGHLVVVTGLSGAGKSSLVFETIHAEGQRRYVETFSPYTRQFLELLDRPKVDAIENIRPSIAIEQRNTVKTSRSTVGTMTELTDFFKIWFPQVAELIDPDTGKPITDDNPQTIWQSASTEFSGRRVLVAFEVVRPGNLDWDEIAKSLSAQGYTRILPAVDSSPRRLEDWDPANHPGDAPLYVLQDRIRLEPETRSRFIEAAETALHFGQGSLELFSEDGAFLRRYTRGLHSPETGRTFQPPSPGLFSFNSPVGACPTCRGFGRIIEIDYRLVIPDASLSIEEGAIRPFQGEVYSNCLHDLVRACRKQGIDIRTPWKDLPEDDRTYVIEGEPDYEEGEWETRWYGVRRFFEWLEGNTYKMHVRVFLSKYRSYVTCPDCGGARLQPEALLWQWKGYRLHELYQLPVSELLELISNAPPPTQPESRNPKPETPNSQPATHNSQPATSPSHQLNLAHQAILTRLAYLDQVGLGYLTLDRSSRTLSGGETMRVNLTSCLGTALVDTLFVLDEPSIGLHARDIDRLIAILRDLTGLGNTVVVVEHDEAIMRAADTILEIGPRPGSHGGQLTFQGPIRELLADPDSLTGAYLSGKKRIAIPDTRRPVSLKGRRGDAPFLRIEGASKHNVVDLDLRLPLQRFVAVSGVSGSGKSTLLNNILYQGMLAQRGRAADDPAAIRNIDFGRGFGEVVMIDQSPVSRTPRSNPALFTDAWDPIRELFASTDRARSKGLTHAAFSFNSGDGRCTHCGGLGYEKIEMQFLSDVFVPCPICDGKRFKEEILAITWSGLNVADLLQMDVTTAITHFRKHPKVHMRLKTLEAVGLGYLTLGQPLNTLSGGESQRLKLVKYLSRFQDDTDKALLLLDEPTTGLHREDVRHLLQVLQDLVNRGNSVVVIEHQLDILAAADWIIEMGPEAGTAGGRIVAEGTPDSIARGQTQTAPFLRDHLQLATAYQRVAEPPSRHGVFSRNRASDSPRRISEKPGLQVRGAREHNLKNLDVDIPHRQISVITGVSGSGKSSLAFDIVFAEGQRRFMESMSSYARQFVEQLPRPDIDALTGIAPTVAIEQRVTRGSRKSTVATITEVAQYLRLLYARVGIQHHPVTGKPVLPMTPGQLRHRLHEFLDEPANRRSPHLYLFAPLVRGRKGHHQPVADWARNHGFHYLRCDGRLTPLDQFRKLDRYREHDIELLLADFGKKPMPVREASGGAPPSPSALLEEALQRGKGSCFLMRPDGSGLTWLSTTRTDPETGDAFPELDPKHFSWNSARGWCPTCRGHGRIFDWMKDREDAPEDIEDIDHGSPCPECNGDRLNPISQNVFLPFRGNTSLTLPQLLECTPKDLLKKLRALKLDARGKKIVADILPQIEERLRFMDRVGIEYLSLDRPTSTLSGGEAQRIRLAAQLGSNLSGVLYVLDEPSIGLHAQDNQRLIDSMKSLREKGNTLLVVEHDDDTMRQADHIIDIGPGAGIHGGRILARGAPGELLNHPDSLTAALLREGIPHPQRGHYRKLPATWDPKSRSPKNPDWLVLEKAALRNLRGDTLHLPLNRLIMVCGVSGAGKSTLIRDLLKPAVEAAIASRKNRITGKQALQNGAFNEESGAHADRLPFDKLIHGNRFKKVIEVDQSPIGKTPRSTPATYIGAYDIIREFFASLPEAKMRGLSPGTFSFNTRGGRCEKCKGAGRIKLEMAFLPDTYVECDACQGSRYGQELQDVTWKDKTIGEVLDMSFEEAAAFFDFHSHLKAMLDLMVETGLGYLKLGQSSPTLSGGEAQRLKLVSELAKGLQTRTERARGLSPQNLYILEEPTIGLHLSDCQRLIHLLHRLVDQGHTVIVIEHHLDLLAEADYLIEVGPGGGDRGGRILYQGNVQRILKRKSSPTAPFLKEKLSPSPSS